MPELPVSPRALAHPMSRVTRLVWLWLRSTIVAFGFFLVTPPRGIADDATVPAAASSPSPDLSPRWRVHPHEWIEKEIDLRGKTWSEASRYFYSEAPDFAARLRRLNEAEKGVAIQKTRLKFYKPQIQVQPGEYLEQLGRRWVGNSHFAFRILLELNPQITDPHHIQPGLWLTVPRIPGSPNGSSMLSSTASSTEKSADEIFLPRNPDERIALAKWYLGRLDPNGGAKSATVAEKKRADSLAQILEAEAARKQPPSWEPAYAAAQHYVRAQQEKQNSIRALELALRDPEAPIQVAALYLRLRSESGRSMNSDEKNALLNRFPGLAALFELSETVQP
jgi:hypothetical protein